MLVLRHGTVGSGVELHRPGCDRCCPTRASSSACREDRDSGVLREQGVCGVCGRGGGGGGWGGGLGVNSVRDGVLPDPVALSEVVDLPVIMPRQVLAAFAELAYGPDSAENCLEVRGCSEDHRDFTAAVH